MGHNDYGLRRTVPQFPTLMLASQEVRKQIFAPTI